ncbi:MAG: hypothetical protein ABIF82_12865 [Planctomycetota bacterium]
MLKHVLSVLLLVATCASVFGGEADPAAEMPADAVVFVSVKDVRAVIPAAARLLERPDLVKPAKLAAVALEQLGKIIAGRLSIALVMPAEGREEPAFLLRLPVDETKAKADDVIRASIAEFAGAENAEFETAGGIPHLKSKRGRAELYWAVKDKVLYASNEWTLVAQRVLTLPGPAIMPLTETAAYKRLGEHADWSGDVTVFVDLKRTVWRHMRPPAEADIPERPLDYGAVLLQWLLPTQFEAAGFSWKSDGKTGSGRLAVLTPKERKGLAALLDVPNAPLAHIEHIPENVQVFSAMAPVARGVIKRAAKFMAALDPEIAKEFEDELAEFGKELGVDIARDLFDNVGASATAARLPGAGEIAIYSVMSVRDKAAFEKCADALANYNKTPLRRHVRGGRTFRILETKPATGFTFEGGRLFYSNTFEAVEKMLAVKELGPSLATAAAFKKLRARLPKESVWMLAADADWASQMGTMLLTLVPELRKSVSVAALDKLLEPFKRAGAGLSMGVALRNEPGALVVHAEDLTGGTSKLLEGIAGILTPAAEGARAGPENPKE